MLEMEKKLRLGLVWGQRSGAMKAQIATAKFAEFFFFPRTSVNKKRLGDFGPYLREFGALLVAE